MFVEITTDGSSLQNPGPGGWAAIFKIPGHCKALFGFDPHTTNNRMELTAVIAALEHLKKPCTIKLTSDSLYVINGITKWIKKWRKNGWQAAVFNPKTKSYQGSKDVSNVDLWVRLDEACVRHTIQWVHVRGHQDNEDNLTCDLIAREAALKQIEGLRILDNGYTIDIASKKKVDIPIDINRAISFD